MQNFQSQQFKSNPAKVLTISEQILAFHVHRKKKKHPSQSSLHNKKIKWNQTVTRIQTSQCGPNTYGSDDLFL